MMNSLAVEADGLRKAFGQVSALDGLSFQVPAGSVLNLGFGSQADTETAWKVLAAEGYRPERTGTEIGVRSSSGSGAVTQVLRTLDGQSPDPVSVAVHEPTMDDVFLILTQGGKAA